MSDGSRPIVTSPHIEIVGAGVAGLCCATEFIERGCSVTLKSASQGVDSTCCSWWAGGMLAPWCESESAEPLITRLGIEAIEFWKERCPSVNSAGSLVLAHARDASELRQFASRTSEYEALEQPAVDELEPDLAGRFQAGLFYARECDLDPRHALLELQKRLNSHPAFTLQQGKALDSDELTCKPTADWRIDCRGLAARDSLSDLRGVKGEMIIVRCPDVTLSRPIRLLHPRHPVYVVPRADHCYMIGATMIESDDRQMLSVRSIMELLSTACALHPAFGEASVVEMGTDARPAFNDNLPRLRKRGRTIHVNGLFRHGFLCAPSMARRAADLALDGSIDEEVVDDTDG